MQIYRTATSFFLSSAVLRSVHSFSPSSPRVASASILSTQLLRSAASSQPQYSQQCKMTSLASASVSISDAYDGGNGKLVKTEVIDDQLTVYVDMKKDPFTELEKVHHSQYFSFRSSIQADGENTVKYLLANAGDASYPSAWDGSTTFYSSNPSDPSSWKRKVDTTYDASTGQLSWTHTSTGSKSTYFAYFPPFSYDRHLQLISKCERAEAATVQSIGQTLDGREMEAVKIGTGSNICWIIHRQHPGENMAEFYAEGLLTRLLGMDNDYAVDGMVRDVLSMYTFYIVPNMNPDGAFRGHLRTNAGGQNLNREWASSGSEENGDFYEAPTLERSPEVFHVLKKMDETGCDMFLDVHGDEELPFNFLAGGEGCTNWGKRLQTLHGAFLAKYSRTNSDMQVPVGYDPEEPMQGRTNICSNQIMMRYDCLAATLEMPFKDCMSNPDPDRGWNGARAAMLGSSVLEALAYVGPHLRKGEDEIDGVFGNNVDDAYVRPSADYKSM